nr:hypothetical protein [uncultured Prevotella sp.]
MQNNKQIGKKDLKYINVPLSIVNQRWFKSEKAVRAWFFMAWQALMPRYEKNQTTTIKGKTFHLSEGELICTRSYLAKSLGINDSAAKCSTDKLKRTDSISVKQEILSNDAKAPKNKLSRVTVKGVPVPSEPYIKMYLPVKEEDFWTNKLLAQLYMYMMCKAAYKEGYMVGAKGHAIRMEAGDMLINYKEILSALKCKEWKLKECLRTLKESGAISSKGRIGNKGILYHLTYYPQQNAERKMSPKSQANNEVVSQKKQSNHVMPTTLHNTASSLVRIENEQIIDTPVTEAVSYLFFDLKKNKEVSRLNQIIEYVNVNMPEGFPMERLKEAMDFYYKDFGGKYIQEGKVVEAITKFYNQNKTTGFAVSYIERRLKELNALLTTKQEEYNNFYYNWQLVDRAYEIFKENGCVDKIPEAKYIDCIYNALSFAVFRSSMYDTKILHSTGEKQAVNDWNDETCDKAASIESLFGKLGIDGLKDLERHIKDMFGADYAKSVKTINDEIEQLKTA